MDMILCIVSSRIVGQGDIVGRSGCFSLNLSANSVMRGHVHAIMTLKGLVTDLRYLNKSCGIFFDCTPNSNFCVPSRFVSYSAQPLKKNSSPN